MKKYKAIIAPSFVLLFTALCLLFVLQPVTANATADVSPISPALAVIADGLQMKKSGIVNNPLYLTRGDFKEFLRLDDVGSVTVCSLPAEYEGKLFLGDRPVIADQTIKAKELNQLKFVPESKDVTQTNFRFYSKDSSCQAPIDCTLYLLPKLNSAPTVSLDVIAQEKLTTQKNIMVYSTLFAEDSENDSLTFEITTEAKHGIVSFTDNSKGTFTYTPSTDYTGKDSFEFAVSDTYGNRSRKVWVDIEVEDNKRNVLYSDMMGHTDHLDAVKATAYNIMSGKITDGEMCFSPDVPITRAEFLYYALRSAGHKDYLEVISTGFDDDSDIPPHLKGCVAYAIQKGMINGTKTDGGVFFYPNAPITRAEAAVMINDIIQREGAKELPDFSDKEDIPSWAENDIATLAELDIITAEDDGGYYPNENVTNAYGAKVFCRVYEFYQK